MSEGVGFTKTIQSVVGEALNEGVSAIDFASLAIRATDHCENGKATI
jgi:hypothetical protein